jgi:2-methylfumaryl-CoA hydratase
MSKSFAGNFFEDFELHQDVPCPTPRRLGSGEVAQYIALTGDRTARFCGELGHIHPLLLFHQVLSQTVRHVSLNAIANLGYAQLVFSQPVSTGQTVHTAAEVIGLKENSSQRSGIVWLKTTARLSSGDLVLSFVRWVMVRKRGSETTEFLNSPIVPVLQQRVCPDSLHIEHLEPLPTASQTGGKWTYEDYSVGERIDHHDGHTITPGEHMSFTRLFQNSARVHFDALATQSKPLVFGGYPMSIGYAQMLNGLENRLGLVAINSGTHAHPVHAGDTLYSRTEIIEMDPLGDATVGALRCRLQVCKNINPADHPDTTFTTRDEALVLELDIWELVSKTTQPHRSHP